MLIKVRMTETKVGTENGFTNITFEKNGIYEIGASLYKSFRNMGSCEKVLESETLEVKIETPAEEKAVIKPVTFTKKKKAK